MAVINRKPGQGVINIVRFNWHFYVLALGVIIAGWWMAPILDEAIGWWVRAGAVLALASMALSLAASAWVYDLSGLYHLQWLPPLQVQTSDNLLNVHAGFDETSGLLAEKFPNARLQVFDFYNPLQHTEVSIERARKAYPPYPGTRVVNTQDLPLSKGTLKAIFCLLSVHEIRQRAERIEFLRQLGAGLQLDGKILVLEHLRDLPNLLVYNIGFLHFLSNKEWLHCFEAAGLQLENEQKITPFLTLFILNRHGNPS